jgi:hypothetical protein
MSKKSAPEYEYDILIHKPNFECIDKGKPLPCKTSVVSEQLTFETDLRLQETAAKAKVPIAKDHQNAFLYNLMDP